MRTFTGKGLSGSGPAAELGKRILQRLRETLQADHRNIHAEACIDGPYHHRLEPGQPEAAEQVAGLTAWDMTLSAKAQGKAAGILHAIADGGTLALFLPEGATAADVVATLEMLWRQTEVCRVRLVTPAVVDASRSEGGAIPSPS